MRTKIMWVLIAALLVLATLALPVLAGDDAADAKGTLAAARVTLHSFLTDPDMKWIREHFTEAKSVVIMPAQGKGGFIIGGSGGVGVMFTKGAKGEWSQPALYRLGGVSVGLQAGGQKSEVLLFVQSQKGTDSFLSSSFKLGADASVAAGPVGQGAQAATADVLTFSRAKGAYAGASFEGTVVKPAEDLNKALYNKACSPVDILVRGAVKTALADGIRGDLDKVAPPKK